MFFGKKKCVVMCENIYFDDKERKIVCFWIGIWVIFCCILIFFMILIFIIDMRRF